MPSYTFTPTPYGTVEVFQDGKRFTTTTPQSAAANYGYTNDVGTALPPPPVKTQEPTSFSSVKGSEAISNYKDTEAKLSGAATAPPPTDTTTKSVDIKPKTERVTLINPETQQSISFDNASLNRTGIQSYLKSGWALSEAEGAIPDWLTPAATGGGTDSESTTALQNARDELNTAKSKLTNFDVSSDPALQRILSNVGSLWDTRISEMERVNKSREASLRTTGVRIGSQFTGGAGGMMGGIISEEERQGIDRIGELRNKKEQALTEARVAYETQQWTRYAKLVELAQKSFEEEMKTATELSKATAASNAKIKERADQAERDSVIAKFVSGGVTDPKDILNTAQKFGYALTAEEIKKGLENLGSWVDDRKNIADLMKTLGENGAPQEVIDSVQESKNLADAMRAAGSYATTGTGIVGEYLFYKRQAVASGQTPVSFETYQNEDANRKARSGGGANDPNRILSVTEAQALGLPFGTTAGDAFGQIPQKAPTEAQGKDAAYATRLVQSTPIIFDNTAEITKMNPAAFLAAISAEPTTLGNSFVPDIIRQERQAERNFLNAVLRRESGAVISPSEFAEGARQYFPRPGDDAKTLEQKKANREAQVKTFIKASGPAYEPPSNVGDDIVKSEIQAKDRTLSWLQSNASEKPDVANAVKVLKQNGKSYIEIYEYLKTKGFSI